MSKFWCLWDTEYNVALTCFLIIVFRFSLNHFLVNPCSQFYYNKNFILDV